MWLQLEDNERGVCDEVMEGAVSRIMRGLAGLGGGFAFYSRCSASP